MKSNTSVEWYYQSASKKDMKDAREFLKIFGIRVIRFNKATAWADRHGNVALYNECSISEFWSCVFHEMCHVLAGRQRKYHKYHLDYHIDSIYKTIAVRKIGLRAELYVDKKAEGLMKIFLPDIPYIRSYRSIEERKWYRDWLDRNYPI